jgi:nucleotide-binding universal stress UspA family protein
MSEPVILVPLDGSKQALSALPVAKVLGETERAALHILHVGEQEASGEELRSRLGRATPVLDGLTIDARVGTPAAQILQVAGEIKPRLIVMCKHSGERGKMVFVKRACVPIAANGSA